MTLSDTDRRVMLRQLDRDADTRHGLDHEFPPAFYTDHPPSAFWTAMEGQTECPECHGPLTASRDCPKGCLDDLQDELTGTGGDALPTGRDHRGFLRNRS